jgi:hypothetical protein
MEGGKDYTVELQDEFGKNIGIGRIELCLLTVQMGNVR